MEKKISNAAPLADAAFAAFGVPFPAASITASLMGYHNRYANGKLQASLEVFLQTFDNVDPIILGQVWENLGDDFGESYRDEVHLNTLNQLESSQIAKLIGHSIQSYLSEKISSSQHFELLNVFRNLLVMDIKKIEKDYNTVHLSEFSQSSQQRILSVGLAKTSGYGISSWSWNEELLVPLLTVLHPNATSFEIPKHPSIDQGFITFPVAS